MTTTSDCKVVVEETIKQLGGIDIVIANAVRFSNFSAGVVIVDKYRAGLNSLLLGTWTL